MEKDKFIPEILEEVVETFYDEQGKIIKTRVKRSLKVKVNEDIDLKDFYRSCIGNKK